MAWNVVIETATALGERPDFGQAHSGWHEIHETVQTFVASGRVRMERSWVNWRKSYAVVIQRNR